MGRVERWEPVGPAPESRANRPGGGAFRPEALRDLVYIADAALVTGPNLDARAAARFALLSRLPATFGTAAAAAHADLPRRSAFVLITPRPVARYGAAALLREYKGQTSVEQRHFLKAPTFVDAVFLKEPARIEALGSVVLVALLRFSVLGRRVRQHPAPLPTAKRGNLARPTGYQILRHCRGI